MGHSASTSLQLRHYKNLTGYSFPRTKCFDQFCRHFYKTSHVIPFSGQIYHINWQMLMIIHRCEVRVGGGFEVLEHLQSCLQAVVVADLLMTLVRTLHSTWGVIGDTLNCTHCRAHQTSLKR